MTKPFDYINDASHTKKNLMRGSENDALAEQGYNPWLTNLAFSMHADTILYANEMNRNSHIPNRAQYEYYLGGLRPRKRYGKWAKGEPVESLDIVCKAYDCNKTIGKQYLKLLSDEQLEFLAQQHYEGGTT